MQIYEHRRSQHITAIDAIDFWIRRRGAMVIDFSVNYRIFLHDEWHPAVRYDTAHGQCLHVHRHWRGGEDIEWLERTRRMDYGDAATAALADVRDNWQDYRRRLEVALGVPR